jgi:hypothetical protein
LEVRCTDPLTVLRSKPSERCIQGMARHAQQLKFGLQTFTQALNLDACIDCADEYIWIPCCALFRPGSWTIDTVDDATWSSKTATDFASYRAIIIGDPFCRDLSSGEHSIRTLARTYPKDLLNMRTARMCIILVHNKRLASLVLTAHVMPTTATAKAAGHVV